MTGKQHIHLNRQVFPGKIAQLCVRAFHTGKRSFFDDIQLFVKICQQESQFPVVCSQLFLFFRRFLCSFFNPFDLQDQDFSQVFLSTGNSQFFHTFRLLGDKSILFFLPFIEFVHQVRIDFLHSFYGLYHFQLFDQHSSGYLRRLCPLCFPAGTFRFFTGSDSNRFLCLRLDIIRDSRQQLVFRLCSLHRLSRLYAVTINE